MSTQLLQIRYAEPRDAIDLAVTFEESWRNAYQGMLPHLDLERMIARRGPKWWERSARRRSGLMVLDYDGTGVGYVSYGPNRASALTCQGEVYELYLRPLYQGLGFGERLFCGARDDLGLRGLDGLAVWALEENYGACAFYEALGGRAVARATETFHGRKMPKRAYLWR